MPILLEKRQLVTPGDLIAEGEYIAGENTFMEKGKIYAARVGIVEYETKRIDVVALKAFYVPRTGDIIIGTITEVGFNGWTVDINSPYIALLRASDVLSRPFKPQKDDLPQVLDAGDLIVAKIVSYDRTHDPQLTVAEPGLGKITRGQILKITPTKIPRVIGRKGLNGVVLITGKTLEDEQLAMRAILKIEQESHTSGLTDRITQMLKDEKSKKEEKEK
jgi:exosome complex component RRP4